MIRRYPHLLTACFAIWGLAIALSLYPLLVRPAPPGQTAGHASYYGFDARSPYRVVAAVAILPIALALLCRPVVRRLSDAMAERWPANATALVTLAALWMAMINRDPIWVLLIPALCIAACTALRRFPASFSRRDAVLLPTTLTVFLAVHDLAASLAIEKTFVLAAMIVFAVRLVVAAIPSPALPAHAFLIAPLGLALQTPFLARDQRHFGWTPLILAVVSPLILRFFLRSDRVAARLMTFVIYPLAVYSYSLSVSTVIAEGKSRVDFFEAGHGLMPASEMLRGELPYRDILPGHGLIEDGLVDYLSLRFRGQTAGDALKTRFVLTALKGIAIYALTAAATGSPDVAILAPLLSQMGWGGIGIRDLPALFALTFLAIAVRCRRPPFFGAAMATMAIAGFTSLDFAAYTFLAFVVALVRYPHRLAALRWSAIGAAAVGVPALLVLLGFGILGPFIRETFVELFKVDPAYYTVPMWRPPETLAANMIIPEILQAVLDSRSLIYVAWFGTLIFLAVMIARSPLRSRRRYEPLVILATFIVATALSFVERQNIFFLIFAAGFMVSGIFLLFRKRSPLAPIAVVVLLAAARPTSHLAIAGHLRALRGPIEKNWVEISDVPRARGALFRESDAAFVASARKYVDQMPPRQTFFDFINLPILYFLFNRDCPIRQYEVIFYQSEERQREVIARLERNRNVTAAFVPMEPGQGAFDGVASWDRAPLVWKYLQENFEPAFQEGRVAIWRRKP